MDPKKGLQGFLVAIFALLSGLGPSIRIVKEQH